MLNCFQSLDASDMLQHIGNLRQAIRFAVSDFKGSELPGFCLPKKVSFIMAALLQGN